MSMSDDFLENINPAFLEEVEGGSGVKVSACFQCRKCTNGCPVTFAMDLSILEEMRLGWTMYRKGRLNLLPHSIKGKSEVRQLFQG